ncbi:hypothetical protein [Streptomyces acidiscabies]|uniref:Uncharacterized protein n=1 Tax=Streptomyces acidiscabies TaxID=42234 RepID=A0ABU4LW35_9ACTN|nr:hypothetical protein [Streptomyces acidiscabies]MDX3019903.1 hypothetical protein [Streptomyces acidiscabies]
MAGRASGTGGVNSRCPACRAPLLVQWVGGVAALQARVNLPPAGDQLPYQAALAASTPNDLVWCLPRRNYGPLRLRWTTGRHPPDCPHQHLTAHHCPPAEPTTLF